MSDKTKLIQDSTNPDQLCINTIRFLSVDAVQKANSGHPGMPLDAAPMAYDLWTRFLRPVVMREFGFTVENVCEKALAVLK